MGTRPPGGTAHEPSITLVDESSFPALIELLDDPDALVRVEAIHALACDRCKHDACRPVAGAVLPKAVDVLTDDADPHVRGLRR